ncbi:acyltransferase [Mesorhizobium sp. M0136]|uniref:acyltransferase family protein n=1 Tax=Mesorhizobium sp. M0136 TaxID=2956890 RepID=UPI0033350618
MFSDLRYSNCPVLIELICGVGPVSSKPYRRQKGASIANSPSRPSFLALDLLRGASALVVMMAHLRGYSLPAYGALPASDQGLITALFYAVTRPGHPAVMVFFVLSGFLVGGQVIRHVRDGRFDLQRYAVDRATRIFLPLIPALLLTALVAISVGSAFPIQDVVAHIAGLNGIVVPTVRANAPLWSLAYEIWFYVLMGCAGYAFSRRSLPAWSFFGLGAAALVFSVLEAQYLLFWLLGALVAAYPPRSLWVAYTGVVAFIGGIFVSQMMSDGGPWAGYATGPADAIMCAGLAALLPALCHERANRILEPAAWPIRSLSAMSYSLYIFHYPVLVYLTANYMPAAPGLGDGAITSLVVKGAVCFAVCLVFYLLFERRTVAFRNRINGTVSA